MPQVAPRNPVMTYLGKGKVWSTPSKTTPGLLHVTVYDPDTSYVDCTCRGWRYQKKCWHVSEVRTEDSDEIRVNL